MLARMIGPVPSNAAAADASRGSEPQPGSPPPPPQGSPFELPSARAVVGRGFDLVVAASAQIRHASLYVGLLVLLLVGPAAGLLGGMIAAAPADVEALLDDIEALEAALEAGSTTGPALEWAGIILLFIVLVFAAVVGLVAVAIEAQIMAVALLGGQLSGRPLRLREAIVRSRQTFWRVFRAAVLVGIPVGIAQTMLGRAIAGSGLSAEGSELLGTFVGALVGVPFAYVPSGIVLGDVGAREALARSVRLAQTRWRLAFVVALFPAVFSSVQILALGAGGDVVARFAEAANLGFDSPAQGIVTMVVILGAIAAIGSLVFTFSAVLAAPQVVAFVGLTHYVAGLDLARDVPAPQAQAAAPAPPLALPPAPAPPGHPSASGPASPAATASGWSAGPPPPARFRWISWPMTASIVLMALLAAFGISLIAQLPPGG
jgi:hypothetical protein